MEVHEINFYKEFNCLMGDCPTTCCKNWVIIVDDDTYRQYLMEKGLKGVRLRNGIEKHDDTITIKKRRGTCPFFSKDGKCSLQLSDGTRLMPEVCVVFPRNRVNYGPFSEEVLFLSCPEAARLFVENIDSLSLEIVEKDIDYEMYLTNDDENYLYELINLREEIIGLISDEGLTREEINGALFEFSKNLQVFYAEGGQKPVLSDYEGSLKLSAELTDRIITKGLYHVQLKKTGPLLYDLFKYYFKRFDKLTVDEANAFSDKLRERLHRECPFAEKVLRSYFKYYFYAEFLFTYEDYSFLKNILLGIAHVHILELLLSIYFDKYGELHKADIIKVIEAYDRRGQHNASAENMYYDVLKELVQI